MGDIVLSVGREQPVPYRARLMGMKEHDVCLQKDMGGRSDCLNKCGRCVANVTFE